MYNLKNKKYLYINKGIAILLGLGSFILYKKPLDGAKIHFGIMFSDKYPFRPPRFTVYTRIYHPNVNDQGEMCMPIVSPEHWLASQSMVTVMNDFISLLNVPDPQHAFDTSATKEYLTNPYRYYYNAFKCLKKDQEFRMTGLVKLKTDPLHMSEKAMQSIFAFYGDDSPKSLE